MNKLVSRNPVLRFKEGKKIIKALGGTNRIILGYESPKKDNNFSLVTSARYLGYNPPGFNGNMMYNFPDLNSTNTLIDNKTSLNEVVSQNSNNISQTASENNLQTELKLENPKVLLKKSNSLKINKLNRKISNPGAYHNITTWQNKLKDFYAPGTFKVDGIWGKNTEAAYLKYLLDQSNKKVLDSLSSITPLTNFSNPIIENPSNINILVPKQTYNRTQIREFLRNKGVNPYQFNGAQRKALRMILNGQGTDDDKALVLSMGIFKLGGNILPSRNIVKRFKLQKGNKLPTAPKAEKRFRKNSYNTTKDGSRETTTITSQTFGYNRNWPYFRQPATILRIIEGRDTAFVETPEHHIFTKVLPRTALKSGNTYTEYNPKYDKNYSLHGQANTIFNYPITPLEYEILKRRFNTAWNLK